MLPLFVLDPLLWSRSGTPRRTWLLQSLRALRDATDGALVLRSGSPEVVVREIADTVGADSVHVTGDAGPYGRARDERVEQRLGGVPLVRHSSAYAVAPGDVTKPDGTAYSVFTAYFRRWEQRATATGPDQWAHSPRWVRGLSSDPIPDLPAIPGGATLRPRGSRQPSPAGDGSRTVVVAATTRMRDRPDLPGTSQMSRAPEVRRDPPAHDAGRPAPAPRPGRRGVPPRAGLAGVLRRRALAPPGHGAGVPPARVRRDGVRRARATAFEAWREGRTGFPIVDAGMRQLRATGWMHNRVRMIVASFLVKDLHVRVAARRAALHAAGCVDGDLASQPARLAVGGRAAAPTRRRTSGSSTRSRRGRRFDPRRRLRAPLGARARASARPRRTRTLVGSGGLRPGVSRAHHRARPRTTGGSASIWTAQESARPDGAA